MIAIGKPASREAGLWLRWVLANAIGEAIGLGGTVLLGAVDAIHGLALMWLLRPARRLNPAGTGR